MLDKVFVIKAIKKMTQNKEKREAVVSSTSSCLSVCSQQRDFIGSWPLPLFSEHHGSQLVLREPRRGRVAGTGSCVWEREKVSYQIQRVRQNRLSRRCCH